MDCVVAPVLHRYAFASLAVNVTFPPAQNVVGPLAAIVGLEDKALMVILALAVFSQFPLLNE